MKCEGEDVITDFEIESLREWGAARDPRGMLSRALDELLALRARVAEVEGERDRYRRALEEIVKDAPPPEWPATPPCDPWTTYRMPNGREVGGDDAGDQGEYSSWCEHARLAAIARAALAPPPPEPPEATPPEPVPATPGPDPKCVSLRVVVQGEDVIVAADESAPLSDVARSALAQSGNTGRPAGEWQLRDDAGAQLDQRRAAGDYRFRDGATLYLSVMVGAGGVAPARAALAPPPPEPPGDHVTSLDCDHCGDVAIESALGLLWDGDGGHCMSCGYPGQVSGDSETPPYWVLSDDDDAHCARAACEDDPCVAARGPTPKEGT